MPAIGLIVTLLFLSLTNISGLEATKPKSLKFVTCLYKSKRANLDFDIDWIGFSLDERYFVGYGLDLNQIFRGLDGIYAINQ